MKTYANTASQGYRQSNRQSFVNNDEEGDSVMTVVLTVVAVVLLAVSTCGLLLSIAYEPVSVSNTPVISAVVTKVGDTTLQLKYSNGEQERFFLNDANKIPEKGQKVKVKRVQTYNHNNRFNVVGYNDDISTTHYK